MPDPADTDNLPARRGSRRLAVRDDADGFTPCPSCGRMTATVGRGACAECWQAKAPDGEPVIRPVHPRVLPLLGPVDDVPDWIWLALASALAGLIAGVVYLV